MANTWLITGANSGFAKLTTEQAGQKAAACACDSEMQQYESA